MSIKPGEIRNTWGDWPSGDFKGDKSKPVQYDTSAGEDHPRDAFAIAVTVEGEPSMPVRPQQ